MTLPAGTRMGVYELIAPLGAGGMGEVYRARDTRLSREAAVKVLPPELAADADRLARFEKEARASSALNHPNIVTVYEVGTADASPYIAMELVDGKTLRELVAAGPMATRRLLPIAAQIADGLAKAHEAGIVHRDLKPENVMVNRDGFVKLLDFGLAKLAAPTAGGDSQLATLVADSTRPGVVMGTVGYMSPEQASGETVDFRSDQFALGSILYEMATGKRAFQKKTAIETLSAILREEPEPMASANPQAPPPLRWIVERCLAKEPENRYAATRDLARDLKQTLDHLSETSLETPALARPKRGSRWWWAAGLVALLAVGIADLALRRHTGDATAKPPTLRQLTFGASLEDEPALSPDGKFLAYTSDERGNLDVVVQPLGGGEPIRIGATDADEAQAAWSPDGSRIAFVSARDHGGHLAATLNVSALELYSNTSHGDIFIAPALGGTPAKLVEDGHYPSWSPDGKQIVFVSNRDGGIHLWIVSAEGGEPRRLSPNGEAVDYQPAWSPDGAWIAYGSGVPTRGAREARFNLHVIRPSGGSPVELTSEFVYVTRPVWTADSRAIIFSADQNAIQNLWRIAFSNGRAGALTRVTVGEGQDTSPTIRRDGRALAFSVLKVEPNVWELSLDTGVSRPVTHGGGADYPQVSPDGKTLLVQSNQTGELAVWTADLQGRYLSRLTPGQTLEPEAHWSRDGKRIAWLKEGHLQIQSVGSVSATDTRVSSGALDWSPDGRLIVVGTSGGDEEEIRVYDVGGGGPPRAITSVKRHVDFPTWSPDGRRVAFQLQRGPVREIWVVPSEGGEARALTKDLEDSHPAWSPVDSDTILFLRGHRQLALLTVSTGKIRFLPGAPEGSAILDYPSWSPDGRRIYYTVSRKTGHVYLLEGF